MPRWKNILKTSDEVHRLKRHAVLREATRIMARRGFHNTSLDDIAEALQVSKGTLYNYVTDKQEILFECHNMALDMGDQAFAFAEAHEKSGYGKLRLVLRAYITWLNGALGGEGIASEVTALRPSDRREVISRRDLFEARLVRCLEEGFKDRSIRRVDPKLAVFTIMGAVNAIQSWYSPKGRLGIQEIAFQTVDMLMRGLGADTNYEANDVPIPPHGSAEDFLVPNSRKSPRVGGDAKMNGRAAAKRLSKTKPGAKQALD